MFSFFTESHVFDDSEDEYEDDYSESLILIRDLDKKIEQKRKLNEQLHESSNVMVETAPPARAATQAMQKKSNKLNSETQNRYKVKNLNAAHDATQTSNSAVRARATNRSKPNVAEAKITEANIVYDPSGQTIEILSIMDDFDDCGGDNEQGNTEFIITDDIENAFDEPFQTNDSNDDELDALIANSEQQFENDPFALQNVTKTEELFISEESTDDLDIKDDMDDDDDDYDDDNDTGKKL